MATKKGKFTPKIGLGTESLRIIEILAPYLKMANDNNYDFVDCAWKYGNEAIIGLALKNLKKEEDKFEFLLYFQSKVWPSQFSGGIMKSLKFSLNKMGFNNTIHTYFLHRPSTNLELNLSAYKQLIQCKNNGLTERIGLCNFDKDTIEWLFKLTGVLPDAHQFECSVNNMRWDRINYCKKRGIEIQGHNPFGNYDKNAKDPVLIKMAKKYKLSLKALLAAFLLNHEIIPIVVPSSSDEIEEIIKSKKVKLSAEDLKILTELNDYDSQTFETFPMEYPKELQA
ncbi:aldo/keto reductase [Candidatus Mycoplasma haematominutum]|uniref:Aldo/keto reductase family oxidoreductase n=1 Tax=Candidatus Mycoplasma haematominutum 'Birmingham 1' TaxID=1116213 RepID=G8C308_9MOLU|nr:aldo/keto reductase [Candidatus Mycoplasma haematominutum]CCE66706.1 aldo/keto reductase family oxidoreductase [Candidatus Mycoplasma haematominutum 'Birmingham 1']